MSIQDGFKADELNLSGTAQPELTQQAIELALDEAGISDQHKRSFALDAFAHIHVNSFQCEKIVLEKAFRELNVCSLDSGGLCKFRNLLPDVFCSEPRQAFRSSLHQNDINLKEHIHPLLIAASKHLFKDRPLEFFSCSIDIRLSVPMEVYQQYRSHEAQYVAQTCVLYPKEAFSELSNEQYVSDFLAGTLSFLTDRAQRCFYFYELEERAFVDTPPKHSPFFSIILATFNALLEKNYERCRQFMEFIDNFLSEENQQLRIADYQIFTAKRNSMSDDFDETESETRVNLAISAISSDWKALETELKEKILLESSHPLSDADLFRALTHPNLSESRARQLIAHKLTPLKEQELVKFLKSHEYPVYFCSRFAELFYEKLIEAISTLSLEQHLSALSSLSTRLDYQSIYLRLLDIDPETVARLGSDWHVDKERGILRFAVPAKLKQDGLARLSQIEKDVSADPDLHLKWTRSFCDTQYLKRYPSSNPYFEDGKWIPLQSYDQWLAIQSAEDKKVLHNVINSLAKTLGLMRKKMDDTSEWAVSDYNYVIEKLAEHSPEKLLTGLLRLYRHTPITKQADPTAVHWSNNINSSYDKIKNLCAGDAITLLIAQRLPDVYSGSRKYWSEDNAKQFAMHKLCINMARHCVNALRLRDKQSSSKTGYTAEQCKERNANWREGYLKALEELSVNPNGEVHKIAHFVSKYDPDEDVRKAARITEKKCQRVNNTDDSVSLLRNYLAAFWWIRIARALAEGHEFDRARAQRQRRRELLYVK